MKCDDWRCKHRKLIEERRMKQKSENDEALARIQNAIWSLVKEPPN